MSQAYECMGGNPCIPYGNAGGHHLEEASPDPAWSDEATQVHRVAEDSVPPPPSSGVTPTLADEELEINIFGPKVTKTGPTCSHCGFKAHNVEQC